MTRRGLRLVFGKWAWIEHKVESIFTLNIMALRHFAQKFVLGLEIVVMREHLLIRTKFVRIGGVCVQN
jgi:hypothetical protein